MKQKNIVEFGKNAVGTFFLIAAAFFVCSTFLSIKTVFADPIAPAQPVVDRQLSRSASRSVARPTSRATIARTTSARANTAATNSEKTHNVASRATAVRTNQNVVSRGVTSRAAISPRSVVSRTAVNPARVSLVGGAMRASTGSAATTYSVLSNKLYTGNYSTIIDSTTGLISADAYSACLDSYYTCMDEICTARSDTKGRCSCAGRATSFMAAEEALEKANEELINLSGQLALLVATKGKDVSSAFQLTDAEKVMNCVSYKDALEVAGSTKDANNQPITKENYMKTWCRAHMIYDTSKCSATVQPDYCSADNNNFGFDIKNINGSSSDILASLKAWADAKDMAKSYTTDDTGNLIEQYTGVSSIVSGLAGITTGDTSNATLDSLANTWGYHLFEYAHNNVCGRVLDSCFNGIYEACGTPPTVGNHNKCMNGQTSNCPYNFNSYVEVADNGDIELNERGSSSTNARVDTSASCFGYSTSTTSTSDPYAQLRGPVADARRSIMQKYLLDANAACDVYGAALQQTAQNIAYQKVAAQQALQQKRLEFYNEEQNAMLADATSAASNFNDCLSEIFECYETQATAHSSGSSNVWSTSRIKTYCAQVTNAPHCYETMICNPSTAQFMAVIDVADSTTCNNSQDYTKNTCRNVVTLNEIVNGVDGSAGHIGYIALGNNGYSAGMREQCLQDAGVAEIRSWTPDDTIEYRCTVAELGAKNAATGYKTDQNGECIVRQCINGYIYDSETKTCVLMASDCSAEIPNAKTATRTLSNGQWGTCILQECLPNYTKSGNSCVANTSSCSAIELNALNATAGSKTWGGDDWGECVATACKSGYHLDGDACVSNTKTCSASNAASATQTWGGDAWGECVATACNAGYELKSGKCEAKAPTEEPK